jgi:hypothetical protein
MSLTLDPGDRHHNNNNSEQKDHMAIHANHNNASGHFGAVMHKHNRSQTLFNVTEGPTVLGPDGEIIKIGSKICDSATGKAIHLALVLCPWITVTRVNIKLQCQKHRKHHRKSSTEYHMSSHHKSLPCTASKGNQ